MVLVPDKHWLLNAPNTRIVVEDLRRNLSEAFSCDGLAIMHYEQSYIHKRIAFAKFIELDIVESIMDGMA